ncbi:MAG: hypothetical protein ACKO34_07860 [Vampirovibrionales bacterium]
MNRPYEHPQECNTCVPFDATNVRCLIVQAEWLSLRGRMAFVENINEVCWVPFAELAQWVVQPASLHAHVCHHLSHDPTLNTATARLI